MIDRDVPEWGYHKEDLTPSPEELRDYNKVELEFLEQIEEMGYDEFMDYVSEMKDFYRPLYDMFKHELEEQLFNKLFIELSRLD